MIFLTVGTQLNFDRLVRLVDEYVSNSDIHVKGQIGNSDYKCCAIQAVHFLEPDEIDTLFSEAEVIVSHAGMGSIISAMRLKKPIIIFPRLASLGEHRNDHQIDTLNSFKGVKGIYCAKAEEELLYFLSHYKELEKPSGLLSVNCKNLVDYIKDTYL